MTLDPISKPEFAVVRNAVNKFILHHSRGYDFDLFIKVIVEHGWTLEEFNYELEQLCVINRLKGKST